ncbi:aldo/keto reductase [Cnuibacter sp. UC19_7]|uniref:aldo/keto reductase n=1 Tax=Cnuibacter sp. UC19_7 TaxID=3350166 RepID=UPI003671DE83
MITTSDTVTLDSGHRMPLVGFGTWQVGRKAVAIAAAAGYRSFDTAAMYANEKQVGDGFRDAGLTPDDVFLTSKVWRSDMGYQSTLRSYAASCRNLGVDALDLFLIHWPHSDDRVMIETWRAMEHLLEQGDVESIGVSNFSESDLDLLAAHSNVVPAVNQIELNPLRPHTTLRGENQRRGIVTTAWSPLGQGGPLLACPELTSIASQHGVSEAQVVLRWMLQKQIVAIPRSSNPQRIAQNIDLDGFELTDAQIARIDSLAR